QGDGAGDGLDHAEGGGSALVFSLGGFGAAGQVNADLVDELSAVSDLAGALDQDLGGAECDGLDGTVLEVNETRRDEEEEKDSRDHHVVVEASAFVAPPEVALQQVGHGPPSPP